MVWGKIEAVKTEVSVPHLHVNETGTITVELLAPTKPGGSVVGGLILSHFETIPLRYYSVL